MYSILSCYLPPYKIDMCMLNYMVVLCSTVGYDTRNACTVHTIVSATASSGEGWLGMKEEVRGWAVSSSH